MERFTEYHCGVAVIKDKELLKEAMAKLAAYEDAEEEGRLFIFPGINEAPNCRKSVDNALDALKMRWAEDNKKGVITMTENEAIKYIQRDIYFINKMIEHDKRFDPKADISRYLESKTVYEMAITALKEIGKYNDCKLCLVPADVISKQCCELDEYKGIGTVEECWEAMEKQKPKKPVWKNGSSIICKDYADGHGEVEENKWADWLCPNCGWFVGEQYIPRRHNQQKSNYCSRCGQAIQWKNSEGMEDENT